MKESFFSSTYQEARGRFIDRATAANATLTRYPLSPTNPTLGDLTTDVAILGPSDAPAVVVSSGLHGAEGFLGSAIQLALLDKIETFAPKNIRWVFIHAINPFGFARIRRFNEHNIDLNRNFLLPNSEYAGAPANYGRLNALLNPTTGPSRYEPFRIKAIWNIARFGIGALKQCVAVGQYDYPLGIFFGGTEPSRAMEMIRENCEQWIGSTRRVLHVDFHSGLGAFGEYKLLLANSEQRRWYENTFGRDLVETSDDAAYMATGTLGKWLQHHFSNRDYRFVTAEFGTYDPVRVVAAIRAENRAHHFSSPESDSYLNAKRELLECFCPSAFSWRQKVISAGLKILQQGVDGLILDNCVKDLNDSGPSVH